MNNPRLPAILRYSVLTLLGTICTQTSALAASYSFTNLAGLKGSGAVTAGDTATVSGYYAASDGGGGNFVYQAISDTPNDATIVKPTAVSGSGRWVRTVSAPGLDVRMFGAKQGTAVSEGVREFNRAAIQAAIDETIAKSYTSLRFGGGRYEISFTDAELDDPGTPALYDGTNIVGANGWVDFAYLLKIGDQATAAGKKISLQGEGATIYTEEENCNTLMLLLDASFESLTVNALSFDRKTTTTRYPRDPSDTAGLGGFTNGGLNRAGVMIWPVDQQKPANIRFTNADFTDCHPAIQTSPQWMGTRAQAHARTTAYDNYRKPEDFAGKIDLQIDRGEFLYPHGANIPAGSGGTGVGVLVDCQIGTLTVTDCYFDGAVGGDLSGEPSTTVGSILASAQRPKDGFVDGTPQRVIFQRNELKNYDFEGLLVRGFSAGSNIMGIPLTVNPEVSDASHTWIPLLYGDSTYYLSLAVGKRFYVGNGHLTYGKSLGFVEVVQIDIPNNRIKVKKLSGPVLPNTEIASYATQAAVWTPMIGKDAFSTQVPTAEVSFNKFDAGSVLPSTNDSDTLRRGVVMVDHFSKITNNEFRNHANGIDIAEFEWSEKLMAGSIISGNYIVGCDLTAIGQSPVGINSYMNNLNIIGNTIVLPFSKSGTYASAGIGVGGNDNYVAHNTIIAETLGTGAGVGMGIVMGNGTRGTVLDGNHTKGFDRGTSPQHGQDAPYTIVSHRSEGDGTASVGSSITYSPDLAKLALVQGVTLSGGSPALGLFTSAGSLSFSLGGVIQASLTQNGFVSENGVLSSGGQVDQPGYGFKADVNQDTGIYLEAENTMGFAADGLKQMSVSPSGLTVNNASTLLPPGSLPGSPKKVEYILGGQSTNANQTVEMKLPNGNAIQLEEGKTYAITATFVGREVGAGKSAVFVRMGSAENVGGVTTLFSYDTPHYHRDQVNWSSTLTVTDNVSGADYLKATAFGSTSTVNWTVHLQIVEVSQ